MKKNSFISTLAIVLVLALTFALSGCSNSTKEGQESLPSVSEKSYFSAFSTQDLYGNTVNSEIFSKAKLTMVNVWATFCNPCINEMPELQKLAEKYADQGFQVVGIVSDCGDLFGNPVKSMVEKAQQIVESCGTKYTHILPSMSMKKDHVDGMQYMPTTVFLDSNGELVGDEVVGAMSTEVWESIINLRLSQVK